ncbi:MAG: hypothetical protein KIC62_04470 [Clostridium sp.]|nr:hypothetical protein [Clostridium sp.]
MNSGYKIKVSSTFIANVNRF